MAIFGLSTLACAGSVSPGSGTLTVLLESEDVIVNGLQAGVSLENLRDGWSLSFEKYLATIGDLDIFLAANSSVDEQIPESFVVDLMEVPSSGLPLWTIEGLQEGRWQFNYATPGAGHGAKRHASVHIGDYEQMVERDWTYVIEGALTKEDGESCPPVASAEPGERSPNGNYSGGNPCYDATVVRFELKARAETFFGPCEVDGLGGFAIVAKATRTVAITIHGDHLFFNGFPEGSEGGVSRFAQWLADCDLNLDGTVTREELLTIAPAALPELDERYALGGSPIQPLNNMQDYVEGQLKTQGHFQGEGECPVDGIEHAHGDE